MDNDKIFQQQSFNDNDFQHEADPTKMFYNFQAEMEVKNSHIKVIYFIKKNDADYGNDKNIKDIDT